MKPLFALLLALTAFPLVGADDRVLARKPIVTLVRASQIRHSCHTAAVVHGCTYFTGQRLVCECRPSPDGWRIDARAQFIPVMVVTDADSLWHETAHVADIERSAIAHVTELSSRRFASQNACEADAAAESARFIEVMNAFKDASNHELHRRFESPAPRLPQPPLRAGTMTTSEPSRTAASSPPQ